MSPSSISTPFPTFSLIFKNVQIPYKDFRLWIILTVNLALCAIIVRLPQDLENTHKLSIQLQNSFALKAFVLLFLISAIASGMIFGIPGTFSTVALVSIFALPKFLLWVPVPYDRIVVARYLAIVSVSIVTTFLVWREKNARRSMQELNDKMKTIIQEKDRFFKLASEAQENERKRISRDLHDDTLQLLAAIVHQLDGAINADDSAAAKTQMLRAKETITQTNDAIRRYCEELRPMLLDSMGLISSVELMGQILAENADVKVDFETLGAERPIRGEDAIHVYRVMQEAFHNIEKHSRATAVRILWDYSGEDFKITITDNGIGMWTFNVSARQTLGVQGMHERMELVDGSLRIDSQPGFGTKISLSVPFEQLSKPSQSV